MKGEIGDKERLGHILDSINQINEFIGNKTYDEYEKDEVLKLAIVKLFEIIGEASVAISNELKEKNNEIEWREMKGMRNILIHDYFGINYEIVWDTYQLFLPKLKTQIEKIYNQI
jgi:uncharacterized protein with HEPN domain